MPLLRRRDRVRTCLKCGDTWRVPASLAKARRAGRWRRGGTGADMQAFGRATPLLNESIRQAIENIDTRGRAADRSDYDAAAFEHCPNCGSAAWTEEKAPRR